MHSGGWGSTGRRRISAAAAGAALLAGCGHAARDHALTAANASPASAIGASPSVAPTSSSGTAQPSARLAAGSTQPAPHQSISSEGADPSVAPTTPEFPLSGSVTPSCVRAGSTASLHVTTIPGAIVAYVAVYHGEKSGAPPPFGYGYGGNDHGTSRGDGGWDNDWIPRADSPAGAGYVVVETAYGDRRQQIRVPFAVSRGLKGGC